jgi:tetratricopeptide (TPR) repeat protein
MKTEPEEATVLCWHCKKRPAKVTYTHTEGPEKGTQQVCNLCLDRLELQDEFAVEQRKRAEWLHDERSDEFFARLDEFEATNRHRDHEGWLARTIAMTRQHELWWAERYEESMNAYEVVKKLGFEQPWHGWEAAHCQALVLEALGRHEEALAAFEEAFRHQQPPNLVAANHSMCKLVKFSANAGKPVDESWRDLVKAIAADYEVELPIRPTLAESITALFELTENKLSSRQRAEQAKKS